MKLLLVKTNSELESYLKEKKLSFYEYKESDEEKVNLWNNWKTKYSTGICEKCGHYLS